MSEHPDRHAGDTDSERAVATARPASLAAPAVLAFNAGALLLLFAMDASPELLAPLFVATFTAILVLPVFRYIRHGRIVATPALILLGLMALYTMPALLSDLVGNYDSYRELARSGLLLTITLNGVALVVLALDRPRPRPALAGWIEGNHRFLTVPSYVLIVVGLVWLVLNFHSLNSIYDYLFNNTYLEKHNYFRGAAALGLFTVCFELAGMLSALALAIPPARRGHALVVDLVPMGLMVVFMMNQGCRASIVWIVCQYFVARSFWPRAGVPIPMLLGVVGALAPIFLVWAHIRNEISGEGVFDTQEIGYRINNSDWMNLHESEISVVLTNGRHLLNLVETGTWDYRWGETMLLDPLYALIPRAVWPDRPDVIQVAFTHAVDPSYPEGGTLRFSLVLEGFLNFGIAGAFVWSALVAWCLVALLDAAERQARAREWWRCLAIFVVNAHLWYYFINDLGDTARHCFIVLVLLGVTASPVRAAMLRWTGREAMRRAAPVPAPHAA
jgi:hypothetical protein